MQKRVDRRIFEIKKQTISIIEKKLDRKISYSSISPSLFLYMEFRDLSIIENDRELININRIRIYYNLFEILSGNALNSLKEIRIVKSEFTFNYDEDRELFNLFSMDRKNEKTTRNFPDLTINGRNLKIKLIKGTESIQFSRLFFNLNHIDEQFKYNIRGTLKTDIDQFKFAAGSAKFLLSGLLSDNLDLFNTRISLKSIDTNSVSIDKLSLQISYRDGEFDIRKVSDARPLDLRLIYSTINRQVTGNFTSENFIPLDYFNPKNIDPSILRWLGTSITGTAEFKYLLDSEDYSYSADLEAITNNPMLPVQVTAITALTGDSKGVVFSKLKASTRDGLISFKGGIDFEHFLPSGNLYLSYNLDTTKINADIIIKSKDNNLSILGKNIKINNVNLFNFQSNTVFFENDIDFNLSFSLLNPNNYSLLQEDIISIDGNFQYNPDFFVNMSINIINTPIKSLINILPAKFVSYLDDIPKMDLNTELFISTDFEQYSVSAPQIHISSEQGDKIDFSAFGNNESVEINNIFVNWNNKNLNGTIKGKLSNRSIVVDIDSLYEELPYTVNIKYYPGTGIFFNGMYGLQGSLFSVGNISEFRLIMKDFPVPADMNISRISLDVEGYFNNYRDWKAVINSLGIDNIPGLITENSLNLGGYISENKISLTSINYSDILSSLSGSADFTYNFFGNRELEGTFSLHSVEEELYEGTLSLLNKEIFFKSAFNNAPLNRFNNVPLSGYLNGELLVDGSISEPDISLTLQLENGEFNSSPLEIETSIDFHENQLQMDYLRLNYMGQVLQKGNGMYNLNTGKIFFETEYLGLINKIHLSSSMKIEGSTVQFNSRPELSEIISNNYNLLFSFSNILIDTKFSDPWDFQIERDDKIISFKGGPKSSISGSINDNGSFNIISKGPLPVRCKADGSVTDGLIDLAITNLEVDVPVINIIPIGEFVEFTGGTAFGHLNLSGSIKDPDFDGILNARDVIGNVPMVPENISPFDTSIIFKDKTMTIGPENLKISDDTVNIGFNLSISKWILSSWALIIETLEEDRLHIVYNIPDIGLDIDGFATGNMKILNNEYGVTINSDLLVNDCIINLSPISQENISGSGSIFTNMKFTTGRGVQFLWPSNTLPILRAIADTGQVLNFTMDKLSGTYSLKGDIGIKYGSIYYFQKSFYLSEGSLIFNENETKFDPLLNFTAQIREVDDEGEVVNISLILDKMPVSQFSPRFESNPPLSDIEIFSILGTGVFMQLGDEQIDLSSALLLTGDLVTQFGVIRSFEKKVKDIFKLDLFSIRTRVIQNILIDRFVDTGTTNQEIYPNSFGRYLDNTSLYLGKYLGDDIFLQARLEVSTQKILESDQLYATNELFIDSSVSMEWQTPLFLLGFTVKPDFDDPVSSIQNTSLELSWGYSY